MTNAEKYLKDGINKEELFSGIANAFFGECSECDKARLNNFFYEEIKPTLTEDERVILRNIDKHFYTKIFRNECLFLSGEHTSDLVFTQYDHLFQFIKERRRIQDRGVIKRRTKQCIENL